jgi:hypothetical protein
LDHILHWVTDRWLTWSIVGEVGLKFWVQLMWSSVATGDLTAWARCYYGICVKIDMARLPFTSLHKKRLSTKILSTGSSFHPQPHASGHTCEHVYQRACIVSERRTGWSTTLLHVFKQVILLWVYKWSTWSIVGKVGQKFWV